MLISEKFLGCLSACTSEVGMTGLNVNLNFAKMNHFFELITALLSNPSPPKKKPLGFLLTHLNTSEGMKE